MNSKGSKTSEPSRPYSDLIKLLIEIQNSQKFQHKIIWKQLQISMIQKHLKIYISRKKIDIIPKQWHVQK